MGPAVCIKLFYEKFAGAGWNWYIAGRLSWNDVDRFYCQNARRAVEV